MQKKNGNLNLTSFLTSKEMVSYFWVITRSLSLPTFVSRFGISCFILEVSCLPALFLLLSSDYLTLLTCVTLT